MATSTTTPPTNPIPKQQPIVATTGGHQAFLLLIGEVIGVLILSWLASMNDRLGVVIVAILAVLWLIWIMNNAGAGGIVQQWASKVGL